MLGDEPAPGITYGHCASPVAEPKNERQNRTDQESRRDWKIEREVPMLHDDVALLQAPQPEGAAPSPQPNRHEDQSE